MRKSLVAILASAAFLGWLNWSANGPLAVAQVVPQVQQWEYLTVNKPLGDVESVTGLNAWLNEQGKEGWEFCDCVRLAQSWRCVFKRPKK